MDRHIKNGYVLYCDGSYRPQDRAAGTAVLMIKMVDGQAAEFQLNAKVERTTSSHTTELMALKNALTWAKKLSSKHGLPIQIIPDYDRSAEILADSPGCSKNRHYHHLREAAGPLLPKLIVSCVKGHAGNPYNALVDRASRWIAQEKSLHKRWKKGLCKSLENKGCQPSEIPTELFLNSYQQEN